MLFRAALDFTLIILALAMTVIAGITLWWTMHAWRTPQSFEDSGYSVADEPQLSFSLIMPCRHESEWVMTATIDRLLAQDHPDFEVIISVGHDDIDTVDIALGLAARDPRVHVSINFDTFKNKPRQLNTALAQCIKDVVGIFDAESLTARQLLSHVDATFRARGADVVQGSVHLVNYRASWFSLRNCIEYRTWFRSRLIGHAESGFIPLGGNTIFVKRALMEEVGGWDGNVLAEDCDLGVRLSALGKKIVCVYDPVLTTQEEAPETISQLIKQRTRWALGFMQVLAKGDWKRLPTRARRIGAWATLVQQYAIALTGLALPIGIATALLMDLPIQVALITFLPTIPMAIMVSFEVVILHEFGQDMGFPIRVRDYLKLILSTPFYQLLLAAASLRATWKYLRGDFVWEKTAHVGAHLRSVPAALMVSEDLA